MGKPPWQVPDHENSPRPSSGQDDARFKPSQAWQKANSNPPEEIHISQPKLMRLIIFLVGMGLLLYGLSLAFPVTGVMDPYLFRSLLIIFIFGGAAVYWSRASLMKTIKVAGLWAAIILGISTFYLYQSDFSERFMSALDPVGVSTTAEGLVVKRGRDGHFWLRAYVNGTPVFMMVDTGASNVVLSPEDAKRVGFDEQNLTFDQSAQTANGDVKFAQVHADRINIGDAVFYDIPITVNGSEMAGSLLGMSLLDRFASVEFRGDALILRQ